MNLKFWTWHFCRCTTESDDTGCWGECVVCHKRYGFVSRGDLRAYCDREIARELALNASLRTRTPQADKEAE